MEKSKQGETDTRRLIWMLVLLCLDDFVETKGRMAQKVWILVIVSLSMPCRFMLFEHLHHRGDYIFGVVISSPSVQVLWCPCVLTTGSQPAQHVMKCWWNYKVAYRKRASEDLLYLFCLHLWFLGVSTLFGVALHFFTKWIYPEFFLFGGLFLGLGVLCFLLVFLIRTTPQYYLYIV